MQKAFVILSLTILLGCASAAYSIGGGWAVNPKKTFDKNDTFYATAANNIRITAQSAKNNAVQIFAYGSTFVTSTTAPIANTTSWQMKNVSVPQFVASNETKTVFASGNNDVFFSTDDSSNPIATTVVYGTGTDPATKNDVINVWALTLSGGAFTSLGTVSTSGAGGSTKVTSVTYQNGFVVIIYYDVNIKTTLNYAVVNSKGATTPVALTSSADPAGSLRCIPHIDGVNVYCYGNTKDKTDSPSLLQYITIKAANPSALGTLNTVPNANGVTNFVPFSFKNNTGVVYKSGEIIVYAEEANNTFNFTPSDKAATVDSIYHHNDNIAIFYVYGSATAKTIAYQNVKGKAISGGANVIVNEAAAYSLSKSADGSLFALVNDGSNGNIGQIWGKAAVSLQTAFAAIIAAFAAVLLF